MPRKVAHSQDFQRTRLEALKLAWRRAHEAGAPCFTSPRLVAAVAGALDDLETGLRQAAASANVTPVALLPQSKACALGTALCFPPGGGVAIDPDQALAPDFFAADGPVLSALGDFLKDLAVTGRPRVPLDQLQDLFHPRAESWAQLSTQTAMFLEQVAWIMLDAEAEAESAAQVLVDSTCVPARKAPSRRQRQKEKARQRQAAKAQGAQGKPEEEVGGETELVLEMLEVDENGKVRELDDVAECGSRDVSGSRSSEERGAHAPDARSSSPGQPLRGREEACALNFCEVNTASWGSQSAPHRARDAEVASRSSRGSVEEALNLCEINTASWNSNCSWSRTWGVWNPRSGPRSVQDIMADLTFCSGFPHEASAPAVEQSGGQTVAPFPSLTAEALAALSRAEEVDTVPPGHGMPPSAGMLHVMHHGHSRHCHHHDHHSSHHSNHHFQGAQCQQHLDLPPVPEGSRSTFGLAESSNKLRLLEQRVDSERDSRDRRQNNMRWRLWHHSERYFQPPLQAPADAAGGPTPEPDASIEDSLWLREARWEQKLSLATQRMADSSQRLRRQERPSGFGGFWQPHSPKRWRWSARSASPPGRELPEAVPEDHVLVAVPRSRLEAVARLLASG
ncbi:unnamed protein product [Effrenium voratum]|nr:unnamed protein product [Effrenium voratum]